MIVPPIEYFASWEYERRPKSKGGRVYIQLRAQGEVVFHEGYVSRAEAQAAVTLIWREGSHEDWLRFGRPVCERIIDRHQRIESYAPDQIFALVRWASNDYGTRRSTLDIVRAVGRGKLLTRLPGIDPGGELMLSARGWHQVRKVLGLIDAIEETGTDPCDVSPDHWRHMHNRLAAGMAPRAYSLDRHRAWIRRRSLWS